MIDWKCQWTLPKKPITANAYCVSFTHAGDGMPRQAPERGSRLCLMTLKRAMPSTEPTRGVPVFNEDLVQEPLIKFY